MRDFREEVGPRYEEDFDRMWLDPHTTHADVHRFLDNCGVTVGKTTIKERRRADGVRVAPIQKQKDTSQTGTIGKLAGLLERSGIDPADISRITKINSWQGMVKNAEGKPELVDLVGVQLTPAWAEGPSWPVVQPAAPCVVKHPQKAAGAPESIKRTVLIPDPQIGYRRLTDGSLVPLHDETAIACALELIAAIKPHVIVHMGDTIDNSEWSSKFLVEPEFVLTTQPSLDRAHKLIAETQAAAGPQLESTKLLEGNHDDRQGIHIAKNAMAALRLRQANVPEGWPVLSYQHLLRLDELGVDYLDGYPAGRVRLAQRHGPQAPLYALHGEKLSMEKQAKAERISTVQGHAHHFSMHSETYDDGDGNRVDIEAWSIGCICRIDGVVPSTKGGTDSRGNFIPRVESWQQGISVVTETADQWEMTPVRIRDGKAVYQGKEYTA